MPRKEIVKRLVEEIGEIDTSKDDDVPLEYLEMREVMLVVLAVNSYC